MDRCYANVKREERSTRATIRLIRSLPWRTTTTMLESSEAQRERVKNATTLRLGRVKRPRVPKVHRYNGGISSHLCRIQIQEKGHRTSVLVVPSMRRVRSVPIVEVEYDARQKGFCLGQYQRRTIRRAPHTNKLRPTNRTW